MIIIIIIRNMFETNPSDVNYYIIDFLDFNSLLKIIQLSKNIPIEFKASYVRQKSAKRTIRDFYKHNNLNKLLEPYEDSNYFSNDEDVPSKSLEIRRYIAKYPEQYLFRYPEFMIAKCHNFFGEEKTSILRDFVTNNINQNKQLRTRREIKSFLELPQITIRDIYYTGW